MHANTSSLDFAAPVLLDGPQYRPVFARLLLAHGAGAPMDSPFLGEIAALLAGRGIAVTRFEFAYMAARRSEGKRRPPPRADRLIDEFAAAVAANRGGDAAAGDRAGKAGLPLLIGGKSMGGRVATLIADQLFAADLISGVVVLGYPFHPPKKPENLRTAHLEDLSAPLLVVQGERDPFGARAEVEGYTLSKSIDLVWATDGNHDLEPRVSSDTTRQANLEAAADAVAAFARRLAGGSSGPNPKRATAETEPPTPGKRRAKR